MSKTIPCFICGTGVVLHNETAIAALCEEHRTAENIENLKNTPTHQLLRILNDSVKQELDVNKEETAREDLFSLIGTKYDYRVVKSALTEDK